jgi:hypothetical protein
VYDAKWGGGATVKLTTRSVNKTVGEFSGDLANNTQVEGVIKTGIWHHVTLSASATTCVYSVDGVAVASGGCEARKFLWWTGGIEVAVGGFVGWVDEIAMHAGVRMSQVRLHLPRLAW